MFIIGLRMAPLMFISKTLQLENFVSVKAGRAVWFRNRFVRLIAHSDRLFCEQREC
jgi:hypothetical protein